MHSRDALQLPGAAKRTDGKSDEHTGDAKRYSDEPVGDVAGPRAERQIQPAQRQYRERRADHFVKQLPENPP
jgi:hypothetical protein